MRLAAGGAPILTAGPEGAEVLVWATAWVRHLPRKQRRAGHSVELGDPTFTNATGYAVHPESISQLFDRHLARTANPRIRFHDRRHTRASLLVAAGTPSKVVSERLGHAHPGFTMGTYQHLIPGMSATAAHDFANMIATTQHDGQ